jgi:hypothetical protein
MGCALVAMVLAACSGDARSARLPGQPAGGGARYEVVAGPGAAELTVQVAFPRGTPETLLVGEGADPFVRDVEVDTGSGFQVASSPRRPKSYVDPLTPDTGGGPDAAQQRDLVWIAHGCSARGCRVRYRYLLAEAGRAIDDLDTAMDLHGALESPPSSWLLHPQGGSGVYRFHVVVPPGLRFASGLPPAPDGAPDTYQGDLADLLEAPFSAFGTLRGEDLKVAGKGTVAFAIAPGPLAIGDAALARWVSESARAVATYYRRYPVPRVLVLLTPGRGSGIGRGLTIGDGASAIAVSVGAETPPGALDDDWVLTHEMIHLSFPTLPRQYRWLEEGIATYVEPLARARAGRLSVEEVWRGMLEGLPKGEPEEGDEGLDRTPTWGRTYWGGALFCLVADLAIRERTGNAKSLDDALRAILDAGGTGAVRWPIAKALDAGDRAVGAPVLRELHARMGASPSPVDLDALFRRLGVSLAGGRVVFDDGAPLASVRRSMTAREEPPG